MVTAALAILLAGSHGDTFVSMALCSVCYTVANCMITSHTFHTRNQTYRTLYSTHIYCRRQDVKQAPQNIHIYRLTWHHDPTRHFPILASARQRLRASTSRKMVSAQLDLMCRMTNSVKHWWSFSWPMKHSPTSI
jgi:hypothetical protein